jgi:hypothetical protein
MEVNAKLQGKQQEKCTPCEGMEKGYFTKTNYWFKIHDSKFHQCRLQQDDKQCKLDNQSPLITITASPTWWINKQNLKEVKNKLENCPESWWDSLPKQGTSRRWLKGIGNPQTPEAVAFQRRVHSIMEPFLNYIRKQHPSLQYWKVGALRRAPRSPSQYEKMDWQLHSDYSEEILLRPECE